jgi:hypothetical protein
MLPQWLRIIADNDQDRAECLAWFAQATVADKCQVWDTIQALGGSPEREIVSRFAQLAFGELLAVQFGRKGELS